jgi:hypothetical protein
VFRVSTEVCLGYQRVLGLATNWIQGVVPRVSQSVITAAFLFAFKDVLYEMTVNARKKVAKKM